MMYFAIACAVYVAVGLLAAVMDTTGLIKSPPVFFLLGVFSALPFIFIFAARLA